MNVLHVFRSLHPSVGGPLAYLHALLAALRHDVSVTVASLEPVPPAAMVRPAFAGSGILGPVKALRLAFWLWRHAREYPLVHIHGVFGWHVMLTAGICGHTGVPYVLSTHGHLLPNALAQKSAKKRGYLALAGRRILRRATAVIATTPLEERAIRATSPAAKVAIVPPGIGATKVLPRRSASNRQLQMLYLGRLHPHKQIPLLLEAVAALPSNFAWRLQLGGTGEPDYVTQLRHCASALALGSRVVFSGYLDEPQKWSALAEADLLVLPSVSENFSFAVAEALAQGVPVIVTDEIGLAEMVAKYGCGGVVPVGNVIALTAAIAKLAEPERLRAAGSAARRCADTELTLEGMRRELTRVYAQAANSAPSRG